ncbi:MFS transporter [Kribbella sp. NPDC051718]|uniref:MFS transporter n=1 Tax=Kribbella sp. NPDC051718 TaxID=3155168 RepID=UPI00343FB94E
MKRKTALLSAGHGSVDLYQGIVPVLVPFLVAERGYDYLAVSGFVLAATLLSSVVQPVFGLLTDRWSMPWLIPASMFTSGLGVALIGVSSSYPFALAAIGLTGVGVAAYHPQAARTARSVTGGSHVGMSWFSLGGNLGFAVAPAAGPLLAYSGLAASPLLILPAVAGAAITVPLLRSGGAARLRPRELLGVDDWPAFRTLTAIIVLRSITYVGLSTFLSLYIGQRLHLSAGASATTLFVLFGGGVIGTLLGGRLATRYGRLVTMRWSYAVAAVALAGVALIPAAALFLFVALTAIALYIPFSLHITLGQDYLPTRVGTASGVTLGLAVSAGGVLAPALAAAAKATSLQLVLACLATLPALATLLTRRLAEPEPEPG